MATPPSARDVGAEEVSLSRATVGLLRNRGWTLPAGKVQGPSYYYYEDETLTERRHRMELEGAD